MAKVHLLLVDDDAKGLRVLEVSLRNAGYVVSSATSGVEAMSRLEQARPALILSDTQMPGMDGFELCRKLKADERYRDIPFVFLTEQTAVEEKIRGLELGADDYLTKPIYIKEITTRLGLLLQKKEQMSLHDRRRFFGSLEDMGVVDLLQTIELGRKSGVIQFDKGGIKARLWCTDGQVVDAECGRLKGEEAVFRLLTWETGTFEVDFRSVDRARAIGGSTQGLLMEGMRRMDEWGRMLEQLPSIRAIYQVDYSELGERMNDLPEEIRALVRLFDGQRTTLQVIDEAALGDLEALAAISRLYFEGILYEAGASSTATSESGSNMAPVVPPVMQVATPPEAPAVSPEPATTTLSGWLAEALDRNPAPRVEDSLLSMPPQPVAVSKAPAAAAPPRSIAPAPAPATSLPPGNASLVDELLTSAQTLPPLKLPASVLAAAEARASRSPAARALTGGPVSTDEETFFDEPTAEPLPEPDLVVSEEPPRANMRQAHVFLALVAVMVAAIALYWTFRDEVEPRAPTPGAADRNWTDEALAKKAVPSLTPLDGGFAAPVSAAAPASSSTAAAPAATPDAGPAPPPSVAEVGSAAEEPPKPTTDDFRALLQEGLALHEKRKYREAAERFEKALAGAPGNEQGLLAYAQTLLELGRNGDALKTAEKVAQVNPRNGRAHLIIGSVRQELGEKQAAVAAYQKYLELAPDDRYANDVRRVIETIR